MNLIPFYNNVISWNVFVGNDINNENLIKLYVNLVKEESNEIFDSIENKDPKEFIDGVCDSLVVGSFLRTLKTKNNFDKHIQSYNKIEINESISNIKLYIKNNTISQNIKEIISDLENICFSSNFNYVAACEEVMRSNWSKFPLLKEVNPHEEINYIEKQGRYKGITYTINEDGEKRKRYIFKDENGKVVKPSTFSEPNLEQFVSKEFLSEFQLINKI